MDGVSNGISQELDFNVSRAFEETLDEDGSITKGCLGLTDRAFEKSLEVRLLPHDTHTTPSSSHGGFDDNWKSILLNEGLSVSISIYGSWCTWDDWDANFHGCKP